MAGENEKESMGTKKLNTGHKFTHRNETNTAQYSNVTMLHQSNWIMCIHAIMRIKLYYIYI